MINNSKYVILEDTKDGYIFFSENDGKYTDPKSYNGEKLVTAFVERFAIINYANTISEATNIILGIHEQ